MNTTQTIIILSITIAVVLFLWVAYNKIIRHKNLVKEAWGAIDVTLKKRHNLVPNLIAVVKSIAQHEKELFEEVTKWRSQAMQAKDSQDEKGLALAETNLSSALGHLNVIVENYPTLVSGENYLKLQTQLEEIEDEIAYARRYYNGCIRNFNTLIESFPVNLVAQIFGFKTKTFFNIELSKERNVPEINLEENED